MERSSTGCSPAGRPSAGCAGTTGPATSSLIAFSNRHFYDDDLVLFPSPVRDARELGVSLRYVDGAIPEGR